MIQDPKTYEEAMRLVTHLRDELQVVTMELGQEVQDLQRSRALTAPAVRA
jgi:FtsZ-interacting cell division protein YlmF